MADQADIEALCPHRPLAGQTAIVTGANGGMTLYPGFAAGG